VFANEPLTNRCIAHFASRRIAYWHRNDSTGGQTPRRLFGSTPRRHGRATKIHRSDM